MRGQDVVSLRLLLETFIRCIVILSLECRVFIINDSKNDIPMKSIKNNKIKISVSHV